MTNEEIIKSGIKTSYVIKLSEGESIEDIYNKLSTQLYKFVSKASGFTNKNISRGMRDIITEKNRNEIVIALMNIYFDFINKNNKFLDKYDNYVKDMLENNEDLNKLANTILKNNDMIKRMRRNCH